MADYTPIIGMEIHVELKTRSKMFCGCKNDPFHAEKPNIYTCPVCLGMPGGLPVANKKAINWTIKLGLALGCKIAEFSKFDRKHYFYPDLAKGYQISQYDQPLCVNGLVKTELGDIRITRVHLEEDTGKLLHTTLDGEKVSLVDFNRCGVPLVEIVTEPDIHSAEQAKAYAKNIQQLVRTLEISDANMEQGSMRLEANISLAQDVAVLPDYKVEAKNINSFRFLEQAIAFELDRQRRMLDDGETPIQETRGWNEEKHMTIPQRTKETAEDYRYFPDPDLPPMVFSKAEIENIRKELPELPEERKNRYKQLGVKPSFAEIISAGEYDLQLIDAVLKLGKTQHIEANTLISPIVNKKVRIAGKTAEQIVSEIQSLSTGEEVSKDELDLAIQKVLSEQVKAVEDYKTGKTQVLAFLIGMVMKTLGKKADSKRISEQLQKRL